MSAEPIRVVRVIARMNVGGPARHVTVLGHGLAARGFETTLVTGSPDEREGDMSGEAERAGITVVRVPSLARRLHVGRDAAAFAALCRVIRTVRPTIVHTHTAKAGALGRVAARLCGVPVVVHTFHGHVFDGYFRREGSDLAVRAERVLARAADCLVAVSEAARRDLIARRVAPAEKVRRIAPGLDLAPLLEARGNASDLRTEWGAENGAPVVGLVARLVPVKRPDVFLRMAERLSEAFPTARWVLVGDGSERSKLERLAAASPAARSLVFAGFRSDLARVYRALDVVVLCSANEGLPVALVEAQAAGRPVAAFDVGGVREVVAGGATGHVVAGGDEEALAHAVRSLLADQGGRERAGEAGRAHVRNAFSAGRLVGDMEDLYRELLGGITRQPAQKTRTSS